MLTAVKPPVRIEVLSCERGDTAGQWRVTWLVHGMVRCPLVIEDAWVPHGRFRGEGHVVPGLEIGPGGTARLTLALTSAEAAGTVVENAFLIFRVHGSGRAWRVFARMRVEFDAQAHAMPIVESVTAQSIQ
jgi:hypothetical protein